MARYLNSQEKSKALTLAAFTAFLDDTIELWQQIGRPTDQIKYAKTAKTFTGKVMEIMFKDLDKDEVNKVVAETKKMEVVTKYKTEAVRVHKEIQKLESVTPVETDELLGIIELALASCSVCEEPGGDCKYKKLFIKQDIQPLNLDPPAGGCPYRLGAK
jgi:hypothetical protein